MTRKDYIKFAAMFSKLKTDARYMRHLDTETIGIVQVAFMRILEDENPRFNYVKFTDACVAEPR